MQSPQPTAAELNTFRELIQELTGLHFDDWRLSTLQTTLIARMAATRTERVDTYLALLRETVRGAEELRELLNQITVNETYFFRYPAQFDLLREQVLPDLARVRRQEGRPVRIWSAGCSTGEEPYSIAMTARDVLGLGAQTEIEIFASDVSSSTLTRARQAEYSEKSLRLLEAGYRARYFRRLPDGRYALNDSIRRLVHFTQSSIAEDAQRAPASWDAIFCRNVLIYFSEARTAQALDGLHRSLRDDGYLFIGHSEILDKSQFVPCEDQSLFVYRKSAAKPIATPHPASQRRQRPPHTSPSSPAPDRRPQPPSEQEQRLLNDAMGRFGREDYRRTLDALERLLRLSPRHLPALLLRANVFLNLGQHDRSVQESQIALQIDPLASEAYLLLGLNFLRLSRPELAVAELKKAAYLSPDSCLSHFHLGQAYQAAEMPDDARRSHRNALALLPTADERQVQTYTGGFGKLALQTLLAQMTGDGEANGEPAP